jgi:phosphohistidine phosphatase SixA
VLHRRLVLALPLIAGLAAPAAASEAEAWKALAAGATVLFRHANAPGGGDPPGMKIGDCATQRNLDQTGRDQARRIGEAFRTRAIPVREVVSSQWCRTLETARLAFGNVVREEAAFNSFFDDRSKEPEATRAALALLSNASGVGAGARVIVTHQVNIAALTGIAPASGEGVVVLISQEKVTVVGRIKP